MTVKNNMHFDPQVAGKINLTLNLRKILLVLNNKKSVKASKNHYSFTIIVRVALVHGSE